MELGQKLKAARLEAGLSQRQLCGDIITRNMLSQIENGSARPSRATLQALCGRLGRPLSEFAEDAPPENLALLYKAQQAEPEVALKLLEGYLHPDPMLDPWHDALQVQCRMALARQALAQQRKDYARQLLEQARGLLLRLSSREDLWRQVLVLSGEADGKWAEKYAQQLPDNTGEQLLRAQSALNQDDPAKCLACLDCADIQPEKAQLLRGQALLKLQDYAGAIQCLKSVEDRYAEQCLPLLEQCYLALKDFEQAYYYACKQR